MSTANHQSTARQPHTRAGTDPAALTPDSAVRIDSAALRGMLSDLLHSAGRAAELPTMLNGILLHTASTPEGQPVLVGTSTDRFILGQAHEPIESGHLPQTFLGLAAVQPLLAALAPPDDPDADITDAGPVVLSVATTTATLTYAGMVIQVAASADWYPAKFVSRLLTTPDPAAAPAQIGGSHLGVLAAIAERRDHPLVVTVQQPDQPVHIHIGERYRALITPKKGSTPPIPPAFPPPPADRTVTA